MGTPRALMRCIACAGDLGAFIGLALGIARADERTMRGGRVLSVMGDGIEGERGGEEA